MDVVRIGISTQRFVQMSTVETVVLKTRLQASLIGWRFNIIADYLDYYHAISFLLIAA